MADTANTSSLFGEEFGNAPKLPTAEEMQQDNNSSSTQTFRREIDLGDGSGKQVFEADSADALIDKLTQAQENATRKIRELSAEQKPARVRPETGVQGFQKKELTADEIFAIQNDPNFDPQKVLDRLLQSYVGVDSSTVSQQLQQQRETEAGNKFMAANKDYVPTQENANKLVEFLKKEQLPMTERNLNYAFQELKADGLFAPASNTNTPQQKTETRIEDKSDNKQENNNTRRSSGMPNLTNNRQDVSDGNTDIEAEVRKIYDNPNVDQARSEMNRLMARLKKTS